MQTKTLLFFAGAALAQFPTATSNGDPATTTSLTIATAPNPLPTTSGLPRLVSLLPACAIPCFSSAANTIKCSPTDFSCLCRSSNTASFSLNVATCLGGANLFSGGSDPKPKPKDHDHKDDDDKVDGCETDDLDDLAQLAGKICAAVSAGPGPAQLAQATSIVSEALARASATGTGGIGAAPTGSPNGAGRTENGGIGMGMLIAVAVGLFL